MNRRHILSTSLAALGCAWSPVRAAGDADELVIEYLGWAGVKLEFGDNALFIDPQLVFAD